MKEREELLKKLSAAQFAFWETSVFLDTHKNDKEALIAREEYKTLAEKLRKEFEIGLAMLTAMAIGEKVGSNYQDLDMMYISVCYEIQDEVPVVSISKQRPIVSLSLDI